MITPDQLLALKARNPVDAIAGQWVTLRKGGKLGYRGPCPICSENPTSRSAMKFECNADKWVCVVCADGGDVIKLVMKRDGVRFDEAVDRLGGTTEQAPTPTIAQQRGRRDYRAAAAPGAEPSRFPDNYTTAELRGAYAAGWVSQHHAAAYAAKKREEERTRLYNFWHQARDASRPFDAPHKRYLALRGLEIPPGAKLRTHPAMPYFADGKEIEPLLIHRGPAMLAPLRDAGGTFRGLHITWLDPAGPKGKAALVHPETGEPLPAKKMRGSKAGTYIDLGGAGGEAARQISGEGIETTLGVYTALVRARRDITRAAFRAAGDLGNLAGRAVATTAHPTLKDRAGRPQRVPGAEPDLASPAMPVPDAIDELVLLGDGDSDPFLTRLALRRAAARHARPGRTIRSPIADRGRDFNSMMQGDSDE